MTKVLLLEKWQRILLVKDGEICSKKCKSVSVLLEKMSKMFTSFIFGASRVENSFFATFPDLFHTGYQGTTNATENNKRY